MVLLNKKVLVLIKYLKKKDIFSFVLESEGSYGL